MPVLFRFGNRNKMASLTSSEGTGPYVIGEDILQHQSLLELADGTVVEARVAYGTQWEAGSYTKSGAVMLRTKIYESTNGNANVDWGSGEKIFGVTPLAQNVVYSPDSSIEVQDDVLTGHTNIKGLTLAMVLAALGSKFSAGIDLKVSGTIDTGFTYEVLRTTVEDEDAATINLDVSNDSGSTHVVHVAGNRLLTVNGYEPGQVFFVKLEYDDIGGHVVQWWDSIRWVDGYEPAFTPVGGGSDSFRFEVVTLPLGTGTGTGTAAELDYEFIGEVVSEHRPKIAELEVTPNVLATIATTQQGLVGGPNEFRWLSATIATDFMNHKINRTGTVNGGTFKLTIQAGSGTSYHVNAIPYNVTLSDLLKLIWSSTPFSNIRINVNDGGNGANCDARLTDVAAEVGIEFLGPDRYVGYVMSVDSANLLGGGVYQVNTVAGGSGSQQWLWTTPTQWRQSTGPDTPPILADPFRLTFNGQTTADISWDTSLQNHLIEVRAKLEALSNIGTGNIRVRAGVEGVYVFEFVGALRNVDISGDIKFADGFLPQNLTEQANGQIYGTSQNGAAPLSYDEIQVLTVSGNPTEGHVILTLMDTQFIIPIGATAADVLSILSTGPRFGNLQVTGGPIPSAPITIRFIEALGNQPIVDSSVDTFSAGAAVIDWSTCDVARVLVASAFNDGVGTYRLFHKNPIPGKTLKVVLKNVGSDFDSEFTTFRQGAPAVINPLSGVISTPAVNEIQRYTITENPLPVYGFAIVKILGHRLEFSCTTTAQQLEDLINAAAGAVVVSVTGGPLPAAFLDIEFIGTEGGKNQAISTVIYPADTNGVLEWAGVLVDWGPADAFNSIPANRVLRYLEFWDDTVDLIIGKEWFHTGEGGGGDPPDPVNPFEFVPGIGIEINHTVDPVDGHDIYEIDRLKTLTVDPDASTIVCDLQAATGEGHKFTIAGHRNVDVINEKLGEFYSIQCVQGGTGNKSLTFLFEVEWVEGFQPVQTPVVGKSDLFHFECLRVSGPYVIAKFRGWVETTERPQPLTDTAGPTAANEVQQIHISPVPTGGTWKVLFNGATSNPIPYNANATTIRLIVQAMSTIQSGNILVSGGRLGVVPIRLEFVNALGGQNLPQVTVETTGLQF